MIRTLVVLLVMVSTRPALVLPSTVGDAQCGLFFCGAMLDASQVHDQRGWTLVCENDDLKVCWMERM